MQSFAVQIRWWQLPRRCSCAPGIAGKKMIKKVQKTEGIHWRTGSVYGIICMRNGSAFAVELCTDEAAHGTQEGGGVQAASCVRWPNQAVSEAAMMGTIGVLVVTFAALLIFGGTVSPRKY
jgi:energy-converting hydrogenase Eha subunit B